MPQDGKGEGRQRCAILAVRNDAHNKYGFCIKKCERLRVTGAISMNGGDVGIMSMYVPPQGSRSWGASVIAGLEDAQRLSRGRRAKLARDAWYDEELGEGEGPGDQRSVARRSGRTSSRRRTRPRRLQTASPRQGAWCGLVTW